MNKDIFVRGQRGVTVLSKETKRNIAHALMTNKDKFLEWLIAYINKLRYGA